MVADQPEPGDTDGEDDGVDDDSGGEDGEQASDGFVFAADDPVGEGLAGEEAQEIAGRSEERRVGNECLLPSRSRRSALHDKKQTD